MFLVYFYFYLLNSSEKMMIEVQILENIIQNELRSGNKGTSMLKYESVIRWMLSTKEMRYFALNILEEGFLILHLQLLFQRVRSNMQKRSLVEKTRSQKLKSDETCIDSKLKCVQNDQTSIVFEKNNSKQLISNLSVVFDQNQGLNEDQYNSEVSLEEDCLEEHKQVMEKLLKNHFLLLSLRRTNIIQKQESIFKQITLEHYLYILFAKLRQVKPALVECFATYIKENKHFHRFLQHLYYSYSNSIINKVFKYLFYIWQLYYPCLHMKLSIKECISISKRISRKIFKCEPHPILQPQNRDDEMMEEIHFFIEVLARTVVLVMEQSFSNPFLSKWNSSKESDQQKTQNSYNEISSHKIQKRESLSQSE